MNFLSVFAIFIAGLFTGLNIYAIIDNYISKKKEKDLKEFEEEIKKELDDEEDREE